MAEYEKKEILDTAIALPESSLGSYAVRSLFTEVLCRKWLGGTFEVRFLPRREWRKIRRIVDTAPDGKQTLFIPEDVHSPEMERILEIAGKPADARITRRRMESSKNALANFLFEKGNRMLVSDMPCDSLPRYVKNALLPGWKKHQTLRDAFFSGPLRAELEEVRKTGDVHLIAEKEIEIADKLQMVLREYPFRLNSQHPAVMIENKAINCRGASVLGAALFLEEFGIKCLVGDVPKHSILILVLSDGTLEWRDMIAPAFDEFLTEEMIGGISKTGKPLTLADALAYANDPTPEGLMLDIVGNRYRKKLSWVKEGQRQFLTLFPPVLGTQMQVLNGIAFELVGLGYNAKDPELKQKYWSQAVEACKLSTGYNPQYEYAYNTMGEALYNLRRNEEALEAYQKAREVNPENAPCYYGIALTLFALKRKPEALPFCEKYLLLADPEVDSVFMKDVKEKISEITGKPVPKK